MIHTQYTEAAIPLLQMKESVSLRNRYVLTPSGSCSPLRISASYSKLNFVVTARQKHFTGWLKHTNTKVLSAGLEEIWPGSG